MKLIGVLVSVSLICTSGCAWIFQEHLPSDYEVGRHEPRCTTTIGWQVLDGVFGALNAVAVVGELENNTRTDQDDAVLLFGIGWVAIHTASLISGGRWAHECERAQREWDGSEAEPHAHSRPEPEEREPAPPRKVEPEAEPERKVVWGKKPVFCTAQTDDADRGPCFVDEAACKEARARTPDALASCEPRTAAACFNANRVLDGERVSVCAVSVKDCEARRAEKAEDPDFASVASRCGVYRVRADDLDPQSP